MFLFSVFSWEMMNFFSIDLIYFVRLCLVGVGSMDGWMDAESMGQD